MSKFFINRPIVAMVIAIVTVIVGAVTIAGLPVQGGTAFAIRSSRSGTGRTFTTNIVKQLRYGYSIASGCPDRPGSCADGYRADGRCSASVAASLEMSADCLVRFSASRTDFLPAMTS